uniref:FAS1 domain-containing protein n=2 Tax=Lotharella globosa TaxID=91324 RepID=A0A7S4DYM2_9EUKA|mmetsp:Transcript_21134/g.42520  ORF Transcript_21134/g.42520 Transcript_21134/m.42520 type:complete len:299 (+) Transcript_21134:53-949(+)
MLQLLFLLSASTQAQTVVDVVSETPGLELLTEAVVAADLVDTLSGEGPFTVFAPTNASFETLLYQLGAESLDNVSISDLTDILTYHVSPKEAYDTDLMDMDMVPTVFGKDLTIEVDGDMLSIYDETELAAMVTIANLNATNGVVHVIDKVLLSDPTVYQVMSTTPGLEIVSEAVGAAGLIPTLSEEGPFTVFAPTNESFAAVLEDLDVGGIEEIPEETVRSILLYHVVPGVAANSSSLTDGQELETALEGKTLEIDLDDEVQIEDDTDDQATVVSPDLEGSNGIVHVIDKVLIPDLEE